MHWQRSASRHLPDRRRDGAGHSRTLNARLGELALIPIPKKREDLVIILLKQHQVRVAVDSVIAKAQELNIAACLFQKRHLGVC